MRREFEMTQEQLDHLLKASQPVPYMIFGGVEPRSPRERAHAAWRDLGQEMGFDWQTVKSAAWKGQRHFTAEPIGED